jgi:threonine/homoserine/homoserine lactone efflux protein
MTAFWSGWAAGLAYGLLLGPMFFAGVRAIFQRGLAAGLRIVAGSFLSDSLMAWCCWFSAAGLAHWVARPEVKQWLGLTGGLILLGFGCSALLSRPRISVDDWERSSGARRLTKLQDFSIGFSLNTFNPSNWLFWCGLAAVFQNGHYNGAAILGAVGSVVVCDTLKLLLAWRLARRLAPVWLHRFIAAAGIIMLLLGVAALQQSFA